MTELLYKEEVFAIIGAAMDVYNDLGPGFLEPIYQEAMEIEVEARKIPSKSQCQIAVKYKGRALKKFYVADLICYDKVIVEMKALDRLTLREEGQLLNYLKATGIEVGVLINFGHFPRLEWKRFIFTKDAVRPAATSTLREDPSDYQSLVSED